MVVVREGGLGAAPKMLVRLEEDDDDAATEEKGAASGSRPFLSDGESDDAIAVDRIESGVAAAAECWNNDPSPS